MQLGYVGLGKMGGALNRRLMLQHTMRVYDLNPEAVAAFVDDGAIATQDPKSLASECDIVMTCLPTSNEVRDAIFGDNGLAAGMKPGGIIADMTTGDPNATRAMAAELQDKGITLIDAPVSGPPKSAHIATVPPIVSAEAGTIAIMVGASDEVFGKTRPVFESISPNIFHCGDIGTGHVMKLVNNVIAASVRAVTFEAVAMGMKNGLTLKTCADVLAKGSARSYTTEITLPRLVDGHTAANFTLGLMHKDVRLASQLGVDSASPMAISGLVREVFQTALNEFGYDGDVNKLIHVFERQSNVTIVA